MSTMRTLITVLALAAAVAPAGAHALKIEAELTPPAVVATARYEAGPTLPDAAVRVYAPGDAGTIHQSGRTDAEGRFAFVPADVGLWEIVVSDAEGHRGRLQVEVDDAFLAGRGSPGPARPMPLVARWLVGIAIIFGVTGLAFWGKARKMLREREGGA